MPDGVLMRRSLWLLALISLTFGVWRSAQPEALEDFHRVVEWSSTLAGGESPYRAGSETDYPPWALITLAPLAAIPQYVRAPLWILANLGLALAIVWMLVRAVPAARDTQLALGAVLLAASPFRVLGQFSVVSFALALAGARHRSPVVGGLLMGCGLLKPHVGGVLVVAHVLMRDWTRVLVALCVPVTLLVLAGAWTSQSPLQMMADYAAVVEAVHGGSGVAVGHTELEPWLVPVVPAVASVLGTVVLGLFLMVPAFTAAVRVPRWADRLSLELYAFCGLVSLMATRHLSYDLLVLLPLLVAWWQGRRALWGATAVWLVSQLPGWWRRVFEPMGGAAGFGVILELDRALCLALFAVLAWRFIRLDVTK